MSATSAPKFRPTSPTGTDIAKVGVPSITSMFISQNATPVWIGCRTSGVSARPPFRLACCSWTSGCSFCASHWVFLTAILPW